VLDAFRERASRGGVCCDFDGSLSAIVDHPDLAVPAPGAREALEALVPRYAVVAVVTGRRAEEVAARLGARGVRYEGLYGLQEAAPELLLALRPRVEAAAARVPEAWIEDKGVSIAVHYRQAADPARARVALIAGLEPIVADAGLSLIEGKMVLELVPADRPMKGGAVERRAGVNGLGAGLVAGDVVADLDAFSALDRLSGRGLTTVKVAVRGDETPEALTRQADLVVEGPAGLVALLHELA
jgi:trehalose 6-phosphate phosphatase